MPSVVSRVGLISDTHGHLDPRVYVALEGVDAILHAGDVCDDGVLYELQTIAPRVSAVLGNCDIAGGAWTLEPVARDTVAGVRFLVVHDLSTLGEIPGDVDVVVHGHTHKPSIEYRERTLLVNPGSASQRRKMPSRSVAVLGISDDGSIEPQAIMLDSIGAPR
jgi:hypothetical protein